MLSFNRKSSFSDLARNTEVNKNLKIKNSGKVQQVQAFGCKEKKAQMSRVMIRFPNWGKKYKFLSHIILVWPILFVVYLCNRRYHRN